MHRDKRTRWVVCDTQNITYERMVQRILTDNKVNGPVCKFIRRSFLVKHDIRFLENMITGEDRAFFLDMLIKQPVMFYMNQVSYYYYWENNSGAERLRKNPIKSLYNLETIFYKNKSCIDKMNVSTEEKEEFNVCAVQQYIKGAFNTVLEMFEYKLNVYKFEPDIEKLLSVADVSNAGAKAKIRKFLLLNKRWEVMKFLALVRKIYLIIKMK